jgi:CubicO group peptidase (beta-lactamase class C family)
MRASSFAALFSIGVLIATGAFAQSGQKPAQASRFPETALSPADTVAHPLTRDDVSAWLDGMVPFGIQRGGIAGAVVVVVKDGQVLVEKGYGYSDVKTEKPVDPKTTLFRPGSISKLFTWTAVMQLQEQGKLDLDRDVNAYLDFEIPPAFGKPITLRNLMTHTPGFEETIKGLFVYDPKDKVTLGKALKTWTPERIFPPGTVSAYSNYGAALAGYIVERVSGEKFEDYVAHHIFGPLGMSHATFVQPLPKALAADMSSGYQDASGDPKQFEIVNLAPAGALSIAGDDIARFMIAHLNDGAYGGARILNTRTAELMHSNIYRPEPTLPAMGLGFYHEDRNGHVIVGHGGDTIWFHSDLHLILDEHVGLYISQNSQGKEGGDIRRALFRGFMDRYFPLKACAPLPTLKSAAADDALVAGRYTTSRRSESNFLRIGGLLDGFKITANDDNTITVSAFQDRSGSPQKWREIAPYRWQEVRGDRVIVAQVRDGRVVQVSTDRSPPIMIVTPAPFIDSPLWNLPLLIGTLVMLTLTVLFWPVKAILRWRYDRSFELSGWPATTYRFTRIVALIDRAFWGGWIGFVAYASDHLEYLGPKSDIFLRGFQILGILGTIGVIFPLSELVVALPDRSRPWWTKVTDVLIAVACVATVWYAFTQHLLSVGLNY